MPDDPDRSTVVERETRGVRGAARVSATDISAGLLATARDRGNIQQQC